MKVKDIKVGDVFTTERNGSTLSCTIIECRGDMFPGVINFTAELEDGKGLISLCGLLENDYLHFGCNLKEADRPRNSDAFVANSRHV